MDEEALPSHVRGSIESITTLDAEHHQTATRLDRVVARLTAWLGRPSVLAGLVIVILAWIGWNGIGRAMGWKPFDPPPFPILETLISTLALFATVLILTTQRRDERLNRQRDQLTLQLAGLTEQKISRVIAILATLAPQDEETRAMAEPAHAPTVVAAVRERLQDAEADG